MRRRAAQWCDSIATALLFGFAVAAPHSIAGSQGGFLAAAFFWLLARLLAFNFPVRRTPLDWPLLGLFFWATLSGIFSYQPRSSINGLRGLAFFTVFYLISTRAAQSPRARMAWQLAVTLIVSCMFNVGMSILQKSRGDGLQIVSMTERSRLRRANFLVGDVLQTADGRPITSLQMLSELVDSGPRDSFITIGIRRKELQFSINITRKRIQKVKNVAGAERFGITVEPARDFRAHGFYNHYATYAEVLQIIASLALGFLLVCPRRWPLLLALGLAGIGLITALIFTATRAPLAALGLSALAMAVMAAGKRRLAVIGLLVVALPVGVYAISKWRGVGLIDTHDGSTVWRLEIWKEGLQLVKRDPILGIGKGSERKRWKEWGLFRNGELPPGHFHSTPLQVAVWWGLPALALYLGVMVQAFRMLVGFLARPQQDWRQRAVVLGVFGALVGFNASSIVHFNFGDGEVVMVLWLALGLAMAVILNHRDTEVSP